MGGGQLPIGHSYVKECQYLGGVYVYCEFGVALERLVGDYFLISQFVYTLNVIPETSKETDHLSFIVRN